MKEYVLDPPSPPVVAASTTVGAVGMARPPRDWRPLLLLLLIEPLALGALYLALSASPRTTEARASQGGPATIAAFAFPPAPADGPSQAALQPPAPNRIAVERGQYVIDLHGADLTETVELLRGATRATVRGAGVLNGNPARLSRQLVAATPVEAWQAVLGDVSSFAISCLPRGCTVRFVPLATSGDGLLSGRASLGLAIAPEAVAPAPASVGPATRVTDASGETNVDAQTSNDN